MRPPPREEGRIKRLVYHDITSMAAFLTNEQKSQDIIMHHLNVTRLGVLEAMPFGLEVP